MLQRIFIFGLLFSLFTSVGFGQDEAEPTKADETTAEEPAEEAETYANTLRWTLASEEDNFGFNVYRGDAEDGPFERLNDDPILGSGTTDSETRYQYADDTIDPYAVYWYYVESISLSGERERFTPIFPSKPKLTRESEESEEDEADEP